MQKIIIQHIGGGRARQAEEFSLSQVREVVIGRETSCQVQFDPDRDDLVSRQHARLFPDPAHAGHLLIQDLGSRNGTLVNRQRVYGNVRVMPGDTVQLGPGGPEFRVDVEPRPAAPAPPTRLSMEAMPASAAPSGAPPTREGQRLTPLGAPAPAAMDPAAPRPLGRATVERMMGSVMTQMQSETRKMMMLGGVTLTGIAALTVAAYFVTRQQVPAAEAPAPMAAIAQQQQARPADNLPAPAPATAAAAPVVIYRDRQVFAPAAMPKVDAAAESEAKPAAAAPAAGASADSLSKYREESFREWLERRYQTFNGKPETAPAAAPAAPAISASAAVTQSAALAPPPAVAAAPVEIKPSGAAEPGAKTAGQISDENMDSVVHLDVSWKLEEAESGKPVYHAHYNAKGDRKKGYTCQGRVSLFHRVEGRIEPLLITTDDNGQHIPIGGRHTASGFIVSADGFALTNRHVATPWETRYDWDQNLAPACLIGGGTMRALGRDEFPYDWVPANSRSITNSLTFDPKQKSLPITVRNFQGEAKIEAAFAKSKDRYAAKPVRSSDRHDVTLIKIDVPFSARRAELYDNYGTVREGDSVTVMGYPGVSQKMLGVTRGQDAFNRESSVREVVFPSVTTGNVMKIVREMGAQGTVDRVTSISGDLYQLAINTTGAGNSGGPVLDDRGRVIAIFNSGFRRDVQVSAAVPVRYGLELMRVNRIGR